MLSQSPIPHLDDDNDEYTLPESDVIQQMRLFREDKPKTTPVVVSQWPSLQEINEPMYVGSFSWTTSSTKRKIVLRPYASAIYAPLLTPADIARDYLSVKYPKRARISSRQYWDIKVHRSAPLYANPGYLSNGFYVDLKSAYWSILQVIGWDVDYLPGRFIGVRSSVQDFPFPDYKLARNCLVSVGLPGKSTLWTGSEIVQQRRPNRMINLVLWSAVQDVLNSIAADMIDRAGALYVHTDGYIVPASKIQDAFAVADEWGLPLSIRHEGDAKIYGAGMYEMGKHLYNRVKLRKPMPIDKVDRTYKEWLRPRFSQLSERIVFKLS